MTIINFGLTVAMKWVLSKGVCVCSFENIREIVLISASILYVIPFRHTLSPQV
jgi:hypothetical protein